MVDEAGGSKGVCLLGVILADEVDSCSMDQERGCQKLWNVWTIELR